MFSQLGIHPLRGLVDELMPIEGDHLDPGALSQELPGGNPMAVTMDVMHAITL